ncbi:MAG: ABC transporter permease [Chloroflexota bacterium]|nr:ABC transporter permease [Chloroflexota bacterium]
MKKMLLVMVSEISTTLHRKTFLLFAFVLPLVLGLVALGFVLLKRDSAPAAVQVDNAPPLSSAKMPRHGYVDLAPLTEVRPDGMPAGTLTAFATEGQARAALEAAGIDGYYVIPEDYLERGGLTYVAPRYNPIEDRVSTGSLERMLLANMLDGDDALAQQFMQPMELSRMQLSPAETDSASESWISEMFPTLMVLVLYMAIMMPASTLLNAVADEKKNRIVEVLMTSLSPVQLITGKILALGILGLFSTAVWLAILFLVATKGGSALSVPPDFDPPMQMLFWAFVYFLGGFSVYSAQMAGAGAMSSDPKEARSAVLVIMGPMIVAYMFMIVVILNPNGPIALFVSLFPLTSPVGMIARMSVTEVPLWQATLAAVLQFLTAIWIVRLVARLFRAKYLLSGQTFSVKGYYEALLGRA